MSTAQNDLAAVWPIANLWQIESVEASRNLKWITFNSMAMANHNSSIQFGEPNNTFFYWFNISMFCAQKTKDFAKKQIQTHIRVNKKKSNLHSLQVQVLHTNKMYMRSGLEHIIHLFKSISPSLDAYLSSSMFSLISYLSSLLTTIAFHEVHYFFFVFVSWDSLSAYKIIMCSIISRVFSFNCVPIQNNNDNIIRPVTERGRERWNAVGQYSFTYTMIITNHHFQFLSHSTCHPPSVFSRRCRCSIDRCQQ